VNEPLAKPILPGQGTFSADAQPYLALFIGGSRLSLSKLS